MTLRSIGPYKHPDDTVYFIGGVRDDIFAIRADDSTCHFCGLTKTPSGYEFNDCFLWKEYYALGNDQGIGVVQTEPDRWKLVLLNNGKAEMFVEFNLARRLARFGTKPAFSCIAKHAYWANLPHEPDQWSSWSQIKSCLRNICHRNAQAMQFLNILMEWEDVSKQTSSWVQAQIDSEKHRYTEIHVAGLQWLRHDLSNHIVVLGTEKQEWGRVQLPSHLPRTFFNWASPVRQGWLVNLAHRERYLIYWNGRSVAARPFFFPYGEWEKQGQWVLWRSDRVILTPNGQIIIAEPWLEVIGAGKQWAFLRPPRDQEAKNTSTEFCFGVIDKNEQRALFKTSVLQKNQVKVIDQSGNLHITTLPLEREETLREIHIGNQSMLITTHHNETCVLTIADTSNLPPRLRLRTVLFRDNRGYIIYILRGNPDAYVIIFQGPEGACLRILVIDAMGRAWLAPVALPRLFLGDAYNITALKDNHLIVELIDEQGKPTGSKLMIGMENGTGLIRFPDGIAANHEGVELENNLTALEKYLLQHVSII